MIARMEVIPSKTKEFSVIIFEDETRTNKDIHEYYIGQEDDEHIYSTRLNVNNEYNYYKVYNPFTYEYYKWEDGFDNVFLSLSKESFNKIDDLSYSLKEESLATISDGFSTLLYGNPGLELTSLNIVLKEDVLKLESTLKFEDSYTITTTSVVLEKGADVNMDYRSLPFDEVPDETWEEMLNKLNENNYTTVVENYEDDILDSTSIYYTEEDKVYWETGTYYTGYYLLDDGTIQEVYKQNDQFYKSGAPIEDGSLDELRPSLEISRACFDLNDGVYTLKSGVEGDSFALTILEAYADEFDEFTTKVRCWSN